MTNLGEDYCLISPQKRLRNPSFNARRSSSCSNNLMINQSTTAKSSVTNYSANNADEDLQFKRYEQDFRYVNDTQLKISIKDILMPILGQKKAFLFKLDLQTDFY